MTISRIPSQGRVPEDHEARNARRMVEKLRRSDVMATL
jgi:hypothetical protein